MFASFLSFPEKVSMRESLGVRLHRLRKAFLIKFRQFFLSCTAWARLCDIMQSPKKTSATLRIEHFPRNMIGLTKARLESEQFCLPLFRSLFESFFSRNQVGFKGIPVTTIDRVAFLDSVLFISVHLIQFSLLFLCFDFFSFTLLKGLRKGEDKKHLPSAKIHDGVLFFLFLQHDKLFCASLGTGAGRGGVPNHLKLPPPRLRPLPANLGAAATAWARLFRECHGW